MPLTTLTELLADIQLQIGVLAKRVASQPPYRKLAIINSSTRFTLTPAILEALQIQSTRDFLAAWNIDYKIITAKSPSDVPADAYLNIIDNADTQGALGWHDQLNNRPFGEVFVNESKASGVDLITVISHEMCELCADPLVNALQLFQPSGGQAQLYAVEVCLAGDTKIPLLDGTEVAMRDLQGREPFWVYSCSDHDHIRPGRAHSVHLTKPNAPVLCVKLDNDTSIRCTPEHRFLMRDGSYKQAQELTCGDSLMPLYRRLHPLTKGGSTYEQVLMPKEQEWAFTHRVSQPRCPRGWVRHHKDFNHFNNSPDNLELMTWDNHRALHASLFDPKKFLAQTRPARSERFKKINAARKGKPRYDLRGKTRNVTEENRRKSGERGREAFIAYNKSPEHRKQAIEVGRQAMKKLWEEKGFREHHQERGRQLVKTFDQEKRVAALRAVFADPERRQQREDRWRESWTPERAQLQREILLRATGDPAMKIQWGRQAMHVRWHVNRSVTNPDCEMCQKETTINHKVVSVLPDGTADVYDMTVDRWANFATSAGVFVHNCDPVESDSYSITASDGSKVNVSNFVFPSYFTGGPGPWDQLKLLAGPLPAMTPGGYLAFLNVSLAPSWQQINARLAGTSKTGVINPE
jgi:hypothetical protein